MTRVSQSSGMTNIDKQKQHKTYFHYLNEITSINSGLHFSQELRVFVSAGVKNFMSLVQCAAITVVHDVVFFFETHPTFSCDRVECTCSINQFPFRFKGFVLVLQFPNVTTVPRTFSVFLMSAVTVVAIPSFLKSVSSGTCIVLHVSRTSFCYSCSVDNPCTGQEPGPPLQLQSGCCTC